MEQEIQKKAKITGHFRVALKPQDINIQPSLKRFKKAHDLGKENHIEIITIDDDDEPDEKGENLRVINKQSQLAAARTNNINSNNNNKKNSLETATIQQSLAEAIRCNNNINNKKLENVNQRNREELEKIRSCIRAISEEVVIRETPLNKYHPPPGISSKSQTNPFSETNIIIDFDETVVNDIHFEPHYAWDSFNYDREQEILFKNDINLDKQEISPSMRARLVDWLVFMQNDFSLDHEVLYMAVKIADQYLTKKCCPKQYLPLLYLTSILISSKFEERLPPVTIAELMEHSIKKYSRKQVLSFEVDLLRTLNFNIRFPLSYTFLRRFAVCTSSDKTTLTLARFILESSLLEFNMIEIIESKLAAASLLLAFEMLHLDGAWNETAIYYTGYRQKELYYVIRKLNDNIMSERVSKSTSKKKYLHRVFLQVAKTPPLSHRYLDELAEKYGINSTTTTTTTTSTTNTILLNR